MELPLVHAQAADVFLVFPFHEEHTPKCPLYQKWRASVGCVANIASLFCGACRRAPKRITFSALRAGDGRHPVHAADAYGMNAPPLFADPGGLAAAMPSDSAPRRECKIPYGKCRKGFYVYFSHHYSHQKNKAEKEDLSTLFLLRSDASILCSAVIQTRLCSATQAWPTSPTHYPVPTG